MKKEGLLGRLVRIATLRTNDVAIDSSEGMLASLNTVEFELQIAREKKKAEVEEHTAYFHAFQKRVNKASDLIGASKTEQAKDEFRMFRSSAEKLANAYKEASDKEQVALDSLEENLKNVRLAKAKIVSMKERENLDATLMAFVGSSISVTIDSEPQINMREIAQLVHTAHALIEIRTESR